MGGGAGDRISKRSVVTFAPPVSQNFARLGANGGRPLLDMKRVAKHLYFHASKPFYIGSTVMSKSTESYYFSRIPYVATYMYEYLYKAYCHVPISTEAVINNRHF